MLTDRPQIAQSEKGGEEVSPKGKQPYSVYFCSTLELPVSSLPSNSISYARLFQGVVVFQGSVIYREKYYQRQLRLHKLAVVMGRHVKNGI